MSSAIAGLEPKRLWEYFEQLSAIPRGSKNEAKAAQFILTTASALHLEAFKDPFGNVVVRKKASSGRESAPVIALQSHLDIICEKNSDTLHDFLTDPILLKRSGNFITANGTTLGADNGIGVATALAIMEDCSLCHGPLEFVFTIDEETGLTGATNFSPDCLQASILINLDSEDEGVFYVGCAGGRDSVGTLAAQWDPVPKKHALVDLLIRGLKGGHSGLEIHTGRGNAIKLLNRAIHGLSEFKLRICSIEGGNKRNAIPREASAVITLPKASLSAFQKNVEVLDQLFRNELSHVDNKVSVTVLPHKGKKTVCLKKPVQKKLVNLLYAMPHGVLNMSPDIPGLVETSTNCAMIHTSKKAITIETSQRSSVASEKTDAVQMVSALFELANAKVVHGNGYPGWKPNLSSPILKIARETYKKLYGIDPQVRAVHAGLECGIFGEKYPHLDMISLGPTLEMVHSPEERVQIDSVEKYWNYLIAVLDRSSQL